MNSFVDFLGSHVEVGDLVVYAPRGKNNDGLVKAVLTELRPFEVDEYKYNPETRSREKVGTILKFKPKLQPVDHSGYPGYYGSKDVVRPVWLQDTRHVILVEKDKKNERLDPTHLLS